MNEQTNNIASSSESEALPKETPEGVTPTQEAAPAADLTKLQLENEHLKSSLRVEKAHRHITVELAREGARTPGLLFEAVKAELQFDEAGAVANAAALVERLKKSFPEQFGASRPASSIDAGAGAVTAKPLSRESLRKMKPSDIAALNWDEVKRVLASK